MRCSLGLSVALLLSQSAFALKDGTDNRGDCSTGCEHPLESQHGNMTFDDCLNWYLKGCPNNQWPGFPGQNHPNCWPGANAVSYAAHDTNSTTAGALCRIWTCVKEPIYDGNPAYTCVYRPGHVLPDPKNPFTHAFYAPLQNTCLKDEGALTALNGVMTPGQATSVCMQYQTADGQTICAGFWYDQEKKEPTSAAPAPSAPCNIGLETVAAGLEWRVTSLTGDCYLRQNGDTTKDALGGCGYGDDDNQCCMNEPDAAPGTCTNVFKQCGHITVENQMFTFKTCGGDSSTIGPTAHMNTLYGVANGFVTCDVDTGNPECRMNVYEDRFKYHFYSTFQPAANKDECAQDDSTLLRSGDAPQVPIAIQTAYGYLAKEATGDHNDPSGFIRCDDSISYGDAWRVCMSDPACLTFEYACPTVDDSNVCQPCIADRANRANQRCGSKFPSNGKFCYSTFDYKSDNTRGVDTFAVYRKMRQVTGSSEDSDQTVIMT
jgi:hypothetical protein